LAEAFLITALRAFPSSADPSSFETFSCPSAILFIKYTLSIVHLYDFFFKKGFLLPVSSLMDFSGFILNNSSERENFDEKIFLTSAKTLFIGT